ncbi:hypothetical protein KC19_VG002100 [Ceratodon purpureus]|uniref:Uncharacterized protein n=1 Tax=Ceratodon purpureus TaxID=3225 RepID=A0A8T0HKI3_CERPU|nr:hypothetical protein KC19_VG002100 [Ceratodon purpureus]
MLVFCSQSLRTISIRRRPMKNAMIWCGKESSSLWGLLRNIFRWMLQKDQLF